MNTPLPLALFIGLANVSALFFIAGAMILIEYFVKRSKWPEVKKWPSRALIFNFIHLIITLSFNFLFDDILRKYSLFNLNGSIIKQVVAGYLVITFIYYWWHRARHISSFLWRTTHQLHHSPSRLEIITSFYKHPLEIILNSLLISLILNTFLGIDYDAQAIIILITAGAEFFYHWNIKTPYWIGFIVQRPESHCVHHQYNLHHYNYSDLPIWDILFGTFYNPKHGSEFSCGFKSGHEFKVKEMLLCKDLHKG